MDPSALDGRSMGDPPLREKAWEPSFEEGVLAMWKAEPDLSRFAPARGQSSYVIDTPPPYPSGSWHVGAVMAYSKIDMIARGQRMLGRAVLFPFGLDRNGINIERTVERKTGKPLHRWNREAFIAECRKEIEAIGNGLLELAVRVGMSADIPTRTASSRSPFPIASISFRHSAMNASRFHRWSGFPVFLSTVRSMLIPFRSSPNGNRTARPSMRCPRAIMSIFEYAMTAPTCHEPLGYGGGVSMT